MITDFQSNYLYLSALLESKYRVFFEVFKKILKANHIGFELLPQTNDIWCRDYLPVQVNEDKFVQFVYDPEYMQGKWKRFITEPKFVTKTIGIKPIPSMLKIDGGNVVRSSKKVILTKKILKENEGIEKNELKAILLKELDVEKVILIPHEPYDYTGHADGMIRFIDENTVLLNDFSQVSEAFERKIKQRLESNNLKYEILTYKPYHKKNLWGDDTAIGNYINFLEIQDLIIMPKYNLPEYVELNAQAHQEIIKYYPNHKIEVIDCTDIATDGGVLNCISWNILRKRKRGVEIINPDEPNDYLIKHPIKTLKNSDIPSTSSWKKIAEFARTFDGKSYCKTDEVLQQLTKQIEDYYWEEGQFDNAMPISQLRAALYGFFYFNHYTIQQSPNFKDRQLLKAIVERIGKLVYDGGEW